MYRIMGGCRKGGKLSAATMGAESWVGTGKEPNHRGCRGAKAALSTLWNFLKQYNIFQIDRNQEIKMRFLIFLPPEQFLANCHV